MNQFTADDHRNETSVDEASPADALDAGGPENVGDSSVNGASSDDLTAAVEAVLFAVDKPLTPGKIARALNMETGSESDDAQDDEAAPGPARVRDAVESLNRAYEETGRSFRIERVAGGLRVMTLPRFAPQVAAIRGMRDTSKLSKAGLETLAIVAYRQPITRAAIESIRGVACGEVLRTLLERRLIAITGRAEELGRPMLYGTSKAFLESFGLASLKDLPPVEDVFPGIELKPQPPATQTTPDGSNETPADSEPEPSADPATGDDALS